MLINLHSLQLRSIVGVKSARISAAMRPAIVKSINAYQKHDSISVHDSINNDSMVIIPYLLSTLMALPDAMEYFSVHYHKVSLLQCCPSFSIADLDV